MTDASIYDVATQATTLDGARVVGLDWEPGGWRVSDNGAPAVTVSREALLDEELSAADVVVVEAAHMRERLIFSDAQVYTADEQKLIKFRDKVRLFPNMPGQTAKASRAVGNVIPGKFDVYDRPVPDKKLDAETMAKYALANPTHVRGWKRFKLSDDDPSRNLWDARDALRDDLRVTLNPLRTAWRALSTKDKYALPHVKRFVSLIDACYDELPDGVKSQFGIRRTRNGLRVDRMATAITLYFSLYDTDGNLRQRPGGGPYGTSFILKAIGMCNSYKPNMARSQLVHHGLRHYKGTRREYMQHIRQLLAALRNVNHPKASA